MLFNSVEFAIFFPIVTLLYFLLPHKYRWVHLLIASCVFYMAFIPSYVLILFFTILIDYFAGIWIGGENDPKRRKLFLALSLFANIGVLAVFKYCNFFVDNVNDLFNLLNIEAAPVPYWDIILPIGLSFHTFQAMSYTIEVYRRNQPVEKHLGIYALYVMYYPQLVAGPIERPQNIIHQLKQKHSFSGSRVADGLRLMAWGLFKKVVIADNLAIIVNKGYADIDGYHNFSTLIIMFFFSIQIYCDFSGYSDIAIGSSRVMGIDLMKNFRQPYLSRSLGEFWSRWHISLSTWFKDYVYIPLGGNRVAKWKHYRNVLIVFLLSGFWHGASWTFVVWGLIHGFYLVTESVLKEKVKVKTVFSIPLVSTFTTFTVVMVAWVFFRAPDFQGATDMLKNLLTFTTVDDIMLEIRSLGGAAVLKGFVLIGLLFLLDRLDNKYGITDWVKRRGTFQRWAYYYAILALIAFAGMWGEAQFIYFQF